MTRSGPLTRAFALADTGTLRAPAPPLVIDPGDLADLLLVAPLRRRANLVVLQPGIAGYDVSIKRGGGTVLRFTVSSEVGSAAVARLAAVAQVNLGAAVRGVGNAGRVRVRAGAEAGELLVCIGATADGLDAEVRRLAAPGEAEQRALPATVAGPLAQCQDCGSYQLARRAECDCGSTGLRPLTDDARTGGTIGMYAVGERLGDGGMGKVFAGKHALLGRPVAIKLLHARLATGTAWTRKFLAEARAATRVRHPNVIEVLDFGLLDDGRPFLVMERVDGMPLVQRLATDGALDPIVALRIAREVALALEAAHRSQLVHLDLKPANVIMLDTSTDEAPRLKLIDFGAANAIGDPTAGENGTVVGTAEYIAPEHARGEPADGRSDLYALGVMLFEMISGAVPFHGETAVKLVLQHLTAPPPPLTSPRGAVPAEVAVLVARALRKSADERHQNAGEMVADIDKALRQASRGAWLRWLPA